jgi:hypothetical protein
VTFPEPESWFYMSFCDAGRAEGKQFLGGAYIRGKTIAEALTRSHMLGVNPGGEVAFQGPLPGDAFAVKVPPEQRERLLTRAEVEDA